MKEFKYEVGATITQDTKEMTLTGTVTFTHSEKDYGNGWSMYVKAMGEPFGGDGYDIRYDKAFDPDRMMPYIVGFYADKWSGVNGRWKLVGIRVAEID